MKIRYSDHRGAVQAASLPGILAALSRDDVAAFPALRAHQRHPFHAFCCQLAALALLRAGGDAPPQDEAEWQRLLGGLTPDFPAGEPWQLVGEDWSKPALLQPPGMDPALRGGDKRADTPDALDMLLTARNHDLKGARMAQAAEEDWFFALLSLQTQEGQMGAGNYGISRMNGGYGARVALALWPESQTPGRRFLRDVAGLITQRAMIEESCGAKGALALVWCAPWDGEDALPFSGLDPYYIEICRRVRLARAPDGAIFAVLANSKVARIAAKEVKGLTGDPWAPTLRDEGKSWGVSAAGFGYRQMTDLLDGQRVKLPPLAVVRPEDGRQGLILHACAVTRGQGKTEGFHERSIFIPPNIVGRMVRSGLDFVADVARRRREDASGAQDILRHALRVLHQGGKADDKGRAVVRMDDTPTNDRIRRFAIRLDHEIDTRFFDAAFWDQVLAAPEDASALAKAWRVTLRDAARGVLEEAFDSAPSSEMRRLRAKARALGEFERLMVGFIEPDPEKQQARRKAGKASS